jgi:hypothetical protein
MIDLRRERASRFSVWHFESKGYLEYPSPGASAEIAAAWPIVGSGSARAIDFVTTYAINAKIAIGSGVDP